jgi:hypothetical protein
VWTAGCDGGVSGVPTALSTAPDAVGSAEVTASPAVITPEFIAAALCAERPPFRARVTLTVRSDEDVIVRGLGFELLDSLGTRVSPTVIPTSSTAAEIPTTLPITAPTTPPIPIPSSTQGLPLPSGSTISLPFSLEFACGVPASGTLSIVAQTADRSGATSTTQMSVRVRG